MLINTCAALLICAAQICTATTNDIATFDELEDINAFTPIDVSEKRDNKDYVAARCKSFRSAVQIVWQILISNPVSGRNREMGDPLEWSLQSSAWEDFDVPEELDFTQEYLDFFAPIQIPTNLPELPMYVRDKAFCDDAIGHVCTQCSTQPEQSNKARRVWRIIPKRLPTDMQTSCSCSNLAGQSRALPLPYPS